MEQKLHILIRAADRVAYLQQQEEACHQRDVESDLHIRTNVLKLPHAVAA